MQELNVVVNNEFMLSNYNMISHLFCKNDDIIFVDIKDSMYDLLVILGTFSSKSEVRKNWTRTGKEIPLGYNEFKNIGKQKKALYIWNPVKGDN